MRGKRFAALGLVAAATVMMSACSSSGNSGNSGNSGGNSPAPPAGGGTTPAATSDWSKAQSAAQGGGMSALVAAAKKEGTLNIIAVPRDWAGYGAIIDAFKKKYGLKINSENPNGASADEITALKSTKGQSSAPDVVDVGNSYALDAAQQGLFAPYKVATWNDIPSVLKDAGGLWTSDYGGYISIGCNAAKVGGTCPKTIKDLDKPAYKNSVALNGDPTTAAAAFSGVWAAALANGGSATDIQPGIDFFKKLNQDGIFNKTQATPQSVQSGETPIVIDWDYLNAGYTPTLKKAGITWTTVVPTDGLVSSYYSQAISLNAPHPAAARLWEEFLFSQEADGGQNGWLRGYARPIELPAMQKAGTADKAALKRLPTVNDPKPFAPTQAQITAAQNVVKKNWASAVS
jgi:putative spermidine/putrescine transport system substrate-binding protein